MPRVHYNAPCLREFTTSSLLLNVGLRQTLPLRQTLRTAGLCDPQTAWMYACEGVWVRERVSESEWKKKKTLESPETFAPGDTRVKGWGRQNGLSEKQQQKKGAKSKFFCLFSICHLQANDFYLFPVLVPRRGKAFHSPRCGDYDFMEEKNNMLETLTEA